MIKGQSTIGLAAKSAMLIFSMAVVSGCGGGSSTADTPNTTAISGTADKGIIAGGTVTAYPVVNGLVERANPLGSDTTDVNGEYAIAIPDSYNGEPLVLEITTDGSAMMKCDLPSGCGDSANGPIAFGDDYALTDPGFVLQAMIPSAPSSAVAVNITPLTNIAAALAQEILSSDLEASQIALANSQVADRFGITGDLTEFAVIDVTDPVAVSAASDDVVEYAAISAAIIEAVQNDNPELSIEAAIESFAADYVEQGLAGNASNDATTDLTEILTAAQSVLSSVEELDESNTLELASLNTKLVADVIDAQLEEQDSFDKGAPSETAFTTELDQVKAFVAEWRDVATSIGSSEVSGVTVEALATNFSDQISASNLASSDDTTQILEYLAISILAIEQAYEALELDDTLTEFVFNAEPILDSDLIVDIASNETVTVLDIDAAGLWGEISLSASFDANLLESDISSGQATIAVNGSLDLVVEGRLTNNVVELRILEDSGFSVESIAFSETSSEAESEDSYESDLTETLTVSSITLGLNVELEELTTPNPVKFEGMLDASIAGLDYLAEQSYSYTYSSEPFSEEEKNQLTFEFATVSLALGGDFSNMSGDHFSAALAIQGDASGVAFENLFTESINCNDSFGCDFVNETVTTADETEENFVAVGFTLSFSADLANTLDTATVTLSAERPGLEAIAASFDITYPGVQLSAEFDCSIAEESCMAALVNQDGVRAEIITDENGGVSGDIERGGSSYATIENRDIGMVIVYADGDFESL
jgi:hypothetical protein